MALHYVSFPLLPLVRTHFVVNCVLVFLMLIVVALRLYLRVSTKQGLGWDDALVVFSAPYGVGMLVIQGLWLPMGIGYPISETMANIPLILKLLLAYEVTYAVAITLIKLSMLCFYLRLFVNRSMRIATKATIAFVVIWSTANILQIFLICRPFSKTYDPTVTEGSCGDQVGSFIALGASNAVTDMVILLLPMSTVLGLKMADKTKAALVGVFAVGLLTVVVAILRILSLTSVDLGGDLTGTMVYADFLSTTEPNLGIICVSLPLLGPLFSWIHRRKGSSARAGKDTRNTPRSRVHRFKGGDKSFDSFVRLEDLSRSDTALRP